MKKPITFYSEGSLISADLYLPDNINAEKKCPGIVLCHGFAGIKDILLPPYAEKFAASGFISLVFDYRGFGESEGAKGRLVPQEQVMDIRNAITFLQMQSEIDEDNIGLWGTSFGGANIITAAEIDKRVKSIVAQLTFGDGERVITCDLNEEDKNKLKATLKKAWERTVTKNKPLLLNPDQIITDEESKTFYYKAKEKFPSIKTKIPITTIQYIMEYKPENSVSKLHIPLLLIAAEKDIACPLSETKNLFEKANNPKELLILKNTKHYDVYEGENFQTTSSKAIEWFSKTLIKQASTITV